MNIIGQQLGYYKVRILVDGQVLGFKKSCKVINHSPTGFQWGYAGSGPAQLALALLLLRTDDATAVRLHQDFKNQYLVHLPKDENFDINVPIDEFIEASGYIVKERSIGLGDNDEGDVFGECTFAEKCQKATWKNCDCSCGGVNHGVQVKMFDTENEKNLEGGENL